MTVRWPAETKSLSEGESVSASALALMGASVCEAAGRLHAWSLTLLWLSFIIGVSAPSRIGAMLLLAGLALAGWQTFLAWRLAFDRQAFASWARLADDECPAAQREFDIALGALLKKEAGGNRSMADRVKGVQRLHLLQITALPGQAAMLLVLILSWLPEHA